ncbi:sigma-54 dependent transcriptional regulator [Lentimicrobium sp.]|jgi:DNA-binding NtrC family response regulator|uniref:sigma-54-dependent transcriptional regulator n=1 Tax=Lentimicrobium sp. TaxID=2034841 RepID=UPI0025E84D79|nr:sigma-54 dependent transcriptional regulator [Lentimicrobium sp.]MCO5257904.1 sigma-54 dependent transcriptional regulator [Lentimicrobium sp.]MCO5261817.1 sigma-54 dependent transcriptional regulator [Lentimicrobium sp.]HOP13572.1 sigma-54 dependent transcriptional regulator [Lentimicrobium sp.]HPF65702.1 sigma-54 dependent transcriptional regulator [Lentimicrobium sp.]HPJ63818.1 sigma-54 dependent transcriptional regulator [Lentimicrobium sp.]
MASDPFRIFIVEDDIIFAKIISHHLSLNPDNEVEIFPDGKSLLKNLYKNPALISLDYNLPDMTGLEVLKQIKEFNPDTPVVIVSGQQDVATAIELLKKGAYDYILKDQDTKERMWNIIKNIRENVELRQKIAILEEEIGRKYEVNNLIKGNSPAINKVFILIEKAARTNITVSIYGETGTGKELVAKSIHHASGRRKKPFVAVNVTAIPKELIESEMFGHEKGAFTGANNRRIGRFEEANHGTIFLDEIGDMDLNMQSKLLRVLQEEEVVRVGGNENVKLDVRVIVATHKNLQELVRKGEFREDLYYRLLGLPINLPPLRERGSDIALLARFFVDEFCQKNKLGKLSISSKAVEKIQKYPFPGNVRELKAIMELASVMTNTDVIEESDISFSTASASQDFLYEETTLEEYNKKIINHFLQKYDNKVRLVARKLDIGKTTIYRLMNEGKL